MLTAATVPLVARDGIARETQDAPANAAAPPVAKPEPPSPKQLARLLGAFSNDRLKRAEDKDRPITGDDQWRGVDGMWVMESNDPGKALLFPEQVKITCTHSDKTCQELKVTLGPMGGLVFIAGIDQTIWLINSWDEHGLLATYDADPSANALSEKCHRHVLSMSFASGVVSASDIPTHEKGCETFKTTDSYRLVRGQYYVDTTPGNDGGKPIKPNK
jgi:hypothetical protein